VTGLIVHAFQISDCTKGIILDVMNRCVSARSSVIHALRQQKDTAIGTTKKVYGVSKKDKIFEIRS